MMFLLVFAEVLAVDGRPETALQLKVPNLVHRFPILLRCNLVHLLATANSHNSCSTQVETQECIGDVDTT